MARASELALVGAPNGPNGGASGPPVAAGDDPSGKAAEAKRPSALYNSTGSDQRAGSTRSSIRRSLQGELLELGKESKLGTHRFVKGTAIEKPATTQGGDPLVGIMLHPMNIMLICLPLGVAAFYLDWGDSYVFWLNFFAMVPLAKILGDATEELAASLKNDVMAGLLNATFGNAVEMVIAVKTLRAGLYDVVKATLLGSVLSNTLLVLGMSFLCGGLVSRSGKTKAPDADKGVYSSLPQLRQSTRNSVQEPAELGASVPLADAGVSASGVSLSMWTEVLENEKQQKFGIMGALVNTSMLLISCMSFTLITVFRSVSDRHDEEYYNTILLPVSRIASILIILAYVAYTFFQLVTHKESMAAGNDEPEEEDDSGRMSSAKAMTVLFVTTLIVSASTEMLVHAIEGVTENSGIGKHFIGIILLPIVGNACEHAAAVRFAMQDKLGLSVSIAVGSSTQIALFVVPFAVLCGWALDKPMDLNFGTLSTSMITLSVIVVLSMVVDGHSNWLQGYLLCSVYGIIAVMYWYLPDHLSGELNGI